MSRMQQPQPNQKEPTNYLLSAWRMLFGRGGIFSILLTYYLFIGVVAACLALVAGIDWLFVKPIEAIQKDEKLPPEKKYEFIEKARNNSILLTGIILSPIATVGVAWLTIRNSQSTTKATLKLTQQGQEAERFNHATELLSSREAYKQISGINSLLVLATINTVYGLLAEQILIAFVQERATKLTTETLAEEDKEKALSDNSYYLEVMPVIVASPPQKAMSTCLEIRHTSQKRRQDTPDYDYLPLCNLDLSFMTFAHLTLRKVGFANSDLRGTSFSSSTLIDCEFFQSDLRGAEFSEAKFSDVNFTGADISNVDFRGVSGLTWDSILVAKSYGGTLLPDDLINSPDAPLFFSKDFYDQYGWVGFREAVALAKYVTTLKLLSVVFKYPLT